MPNTVVITPTYIPNESHLCFLEEALKSTTRLPDEFIHLIIDDGSPVNPSGLVSSFQDSRVRYCQRTRGSADKETASNSLNGAVNSVLEGSNPQIAEAEYRDISYITILSYDDLIVDLAARVNALADTTADVAVCDIVTFQGNNYARRKKVHTTDPKHYIQRGRISGLNHTSAVMRKGFVNEMREYNLQNLGIDGIFLPHVCYGEDRAAAKLLIYLAAFRDKHIVYAEGVGALHRRHPNSLWGRLPPITIERDKQYVDGLYYPTKRGRFSNSKLIRSLYFCIIKPNQPQLRVLWARFFGNGDLKLVKKLLEEIRSYKWHEGVTQQIPRQQKGTLL